MTQSTSSVDAILCARMGSSRLPGKSLLPAVGKPILELTIERLRRSRHIARLVVATSDRTEDDVIADLCVRLDVPCFRGSAEELLDRAYWCARHYTTAHVGYFGADNPLIDLSLVDEIIGVYLSNLGLGLRDQ